MHSLVSFEKSPSIWQNISSLFPCLSLPFVKVINNCVLHFNEREWSEQPEALGGNLK